MNLKYLILLFTAVFIFAFGDVAFSQKDTLKNKGTKYREAVRMKLIEEAGFSEEQVDKFLIASAGFRKEYKELTKLKNELIGELETEQESVNIESKLIKLLDTEKKICESRANYWLSLKEFLSPVQISKTIVLQKKLKSILKDKRKNRNNN